jgi:hypothetical protein
VLSVLVGNAPEDLEDIVDTGICRSDDRENDRKNAAIFATASWSSLAIVNSLAAALSLSSVASFSLRPGDHGLLHVHTGKLMSAVHVTCYNRGSNPFLYWAFPSPDPSAVGPALRNAPDMPRRPRPSMAQRLSSAEHVRKRASS